MLERQQIPDVQQLQIIWTYCVYSILHIFAE